MVNTESDANSKYLDWKYRQTHKEYMKNYMIAYHQKNKEKINAKVREWMSTHPDKVKASSKRWHLQHREQIKESQRKYREAHKEEINAKAKEYRHRPEIIKRIRENFLKETIAGKTIGKTITIRCKKRSYPTGCELCDKTERILHYHHWDDEFRDKGVWVCPPCHFICELIDNKKLNTIIERYVLMKAEIDLFPLKVVQTQIERGGGVY